MPGLTRRRAHGYRLAIRQQTGNHDDDRERRAYLKAGRGIASRAPARLEVGRGIASRIPTRLALRAGYLDRPRDSMFRVATAILPARNTGLGKGRA